jgi:hypothetical protein
MAEGSERQREQFQQIVDDWAELVNRLVTRSASLAKRMVRQETGERPGLDGPFQDLWMTMAEAAGDVAELSYRWVQAVDGLAGFRPLPSPVAPPVAAPPDAAESPLAHAAPASPPDTSGDRQADGSQAP